ERTMSPLVKQIADEVAKVLKEKFLGTAAADEPLHDMAKAAGPGVSDDVARARAVAASITGERDPAKLDALVEAAFNASVYDTDGALPLAKALEAPVDRRPFGNLPSD